MTLILSKTLDIYKIYLILGIFLIYRGKWLIEKIITELKNSLTKQQVELIKKQKRLNEIDQKFRDKGIMCPNCKSFHCVKNGHNPEGKNIYVKNVVLVLMLFVIILVIEVI